MNCIIPGSFDPITNGHKDLIKKAAEIFTKVKVLICVNPDKNNRMFSIEQTICSIKHIMKNYDNVSVSSTTGLVTDYGFGENELPIYRSACIVRGIRGSKDYAYEEELARIYEELSPTRQVVWLRPDPSVAFISSSLARELIKNEKFDSLKKYVPDIIYDLIVGKEVK